jgi:hypothetical protein
LGQTARREVGWSRLLSRGLMILLTAWALAMIMPDLYRLVGPLDSFGLSADNDGKIIDVRHPFESTSASPAARAGIKPGERLDLRVMHCRDPFSDKCAAVVAVLADYGGINYTLRHGPITLIFVTPAAGKPIILRIKPVPAHLHLAAQVLLLADTVVGVLFVLVAFHLVWTRPSRMTWGFFLYAVWFNPGQDYTFYSLLQVWPPSVLIEQFLEALTQGAAYAGFIAFAMCFPHETWEPRWHRLGAAVPWLGGAIAVLVLVSSANLIGFQTETVSRLQFFAIIPLDVFAFVLLILRRRQLPPQDEERMRWAIAGCAIGLPAFLAAELCQSTSLPHALFGLDPSQSLVEFLYLLHGVIAYFVGTAVRRRRVISVAIPLRRGAILACLTFFFGVPIVYIHEVITQYGGSLGHRYDLPEWVWLLVISPIALIGLTRLHEYAVQLTERVFNRRYHRARDRLNHARQQIRRVSNFAEIDRLLTEVPLEGLRLSSAAVFRTVDGSLRRCGPAIGWREPGLEELDTNLDALPISCLATGRPQPLPRGSWQRPGLPNDDQVPCLAVPICGGPTEGVAIALFGPHVTGSDINRDEQDLLRDFAEDAARGYDRIEVDSLRRELQALRVKLAAAAAPLEARPTR